MTKIRLSGSANRAACAKIIRDAREMRAITRLETVGLAYCMAENLASEARAQGAWNSARELNAVKKALAPLYLN